MQVVVCLVGLEGFVDCCDFYEPCFLVTLDQTSLVDLSTLSIWVRDGPVIRAGLSL